MIIHGTGSTLEAPSKGEENIIPVALSSPPNPVALLKALKRRWKMAICVGTIVSVIAGVACWYFMPPPNYTVRTLLRVPPGNPFLFRTAEPILNLQDHQRNQIAMVKSRLVLNSALKDRRAADLVLLRDKPDPIQWLERELLADFSIAPEVLRISIVGDEPAELVVLINVVREAYNREILDKERADRTDRLTMLHQWREKYESQLASRKAEQRKFENMAGGRDSASRGMVSAFMQDQLNWAQRELIQTQSELRRDRANLSAYRSGDKTRDTSPISEAVLEEYVNKEPIMQQSRAAIQQLQMLLEDTVKAAKDGEASPKALDIRKRITDAEQSLTVMRKKLNPIVTDELRQRNRFDAARSEQQLQTRIAYLEEGEKVLSTEVGNLRKAIKDKAENNSKAENEREDMSHLEDATKKIAQEEEALKIELQAPVRYSVLEEAVATKPAENKRALMAAGGAGAGTFVAVLMAFALLEFRLRRLCTPDDVVFGLGLPLVGSIPDTGCRAAREHKDDGEQSFLSEAVDTFRTMLLRTAQHETLRVVLITSAQSGEGKTSLSTHLAASLAQVGYTTLLIDGDLRNPIAHRVFNLERGPGLCDLLRYEVKLEDVIKETDVDRLSMITAGRWDGGATRALAQDGVRELIEGLRNQFDFIIIDSSPVLPVVDPLLLGQHSDGAILSVLREVSRMPNIYAAYKRLTAGGVRVLGAVMSGIRSDQYGAYYEYAYRGTDADQPAA